MLQVIPDFLYVINNQGIYLSDISDNLVLLEHRKDLVGLSIHDILPIETIENTIPNSIGAILLLNKEKTILYQLFVPHSIGRIIFSLKDCSNCHIKKLNSYLMEIVDLCNIKKN